MERNAKDALLLRCIRRVNLDAFWAREPGTVRSQLSGTLAGIRKSKEVGMDPGYADRGPFPQADVMGYRVSIQMFLKSMEQGKGNRSYKQFDTVRKLRTAHSNIHESSVEGVRTDGVWPSILVRREKRTWLLLTTGEADPFAGIGDETNTNSGMDFGATMVEDVGSGDSVRPDRVRPDRRGFSFGFQAETEGRRGFLFD